MVYDLQMAKSSRTKPSSRSRVLPKSNGVGTNGPVAFDSRLNLVSKEPIHEQILPHLRRDIIENRWPPGERLPEPNLCAEFGVSRTPMRDALKILEADGLIQLVPHVGAVVTRLDPPDLLDRLDVLIGLEQAAAIAVARAGSRQTLRQVQHLHQAMINAAEGRRVQAYYRLNDDFHRVIVLGANNATLSRLHETMMWHVYRARHHANEHEPLAPWAAEHHQHIVDALQRGAADEAGNEMRRHLEEVKRIVIARAAAPAGQDQAASGCKSP
jgi:DNA-binding GntR family transcriptional regulator